MVTEAQPPAQESAERLIDAVEKTEKSALEAVRKFLDTVNDTVPDLSEDGPRRRIIDSAFAMTEKLVGVSNQLAHDVVKVTGSAATGREPEPES